MYVAGHALARPADRWTPFQLAIAARLSYPDAVISHQTAAALHGFRDVGQDQQTVHVIFATRRRPGRAVTAHLLRLDPSDTELTGSGLRTTSPARTAIDCLATLPRAEALDLWAWVCTRGVLSVDQLRAAIEARVRWYGTAQLKKILELVQDGAISGAEYTFHELLRRAGIAGWSANLPISDGVGIVAVGDVVFAVEQLVIEIDGWRAHRSRTDFVNDRRRQNRLIAAGYTVLRFTWDDLTNRPIAVIAEVRAALARAREKYKPGMPHQLGQTG